MGERLCEGCRFYQSHNSGDYGFCRRNPPVGDGSELPEAGLKDWCGEWRDKNVTPEQEERQELVRRFAVALVGSSWAYDPEARDWANKKVWGMAVGLADAEPPVNP